MCSNGTELQFVLGERVLIQQEGEGTQNCLDFRIGLAKVKTHWGGYILFLPSDK